MRGRYGNRRKSGEEGWRERVPGETTRIGGAPLGNLEQCKLSGIFEDDPS